ncbi:MAG: 5'-deoxynucleotidase [Oscillospiraceae bacterium]
MKHSFFALISRMRFIGRWGLMRNSIPENIQEHSHMVAVLAHALAVIRRDVFKIPCDANLCAAAALYHDAAEIFTGDMPTPIKYHDPAIRDAYKSVEAAAQAQLLAALPEKLRPAYFAMLSPDDEYVRKIIKAADKLSAYIKCVEECAAGNGEFSLAMAQTKNALLEYALPEVDYFLENFGEGFGLTLDELT